MNRIGQASAVLCLLACAAASAKSGSAESIQAQSQTASTELDTVTVTGRKRELMFQERISAFVSSVTVRSSTESLARWQVPICPFVTGASPEQNDFIQRQLSQVAKEAGAPLAPADCGTNLIVIVTADPEKLLRDWWSREHRLFSKESGVRGAERFIQSEVAIRAWYNACDVSPDWAKSNDNQRIPPCNTGAIGSRLTWESVRAIYSVIVIVDLDGIEKLSVWQVADYVTVIALAQVRTDSELGKLPTILRLFAEAGAARPRGMSSWDKSFLRSLYATESSNVKQLSQIKTDMGRTLGGDGPSPAAAQARILAQVNRITPRASRLTSYAVTGAYHEGSADLESALINFEAELEFVADTTFHGERRAGDRVPLYGEVEYLKEGADWRVLRIAVYPR